MSDFDQEMWQDFVVETRENLEELEPNLLLLEQTPDNTNLLNDCFRNLHSIKGAAGYMGLDRTATLSHAMENLFHKIRSGDMELTPEIMDMIFQGVDLLKQLLGEIASTKGENTDITALTDALAALTGTQEKPSGNMPEDSEKATAVKTDNTPGKPEDPAAYSPAEEPDEDQELYSIYTEEMNALYSRVLQIIREPEVKAEALVATVRDMERVTHYVGIEELLKGLAGLRQQLESSPQAPVPSDFLNRLNGLLKGIIEPVQVKEEPGKADQPAPGELREEDRELYEIFLDFAREISGPLANIPENFQRDWAIRCQDAIEKLKSSAHYMDYDDVVSLLNEWEERLTEALSSEGKGGGFDPAPLKKMWSGLQAILPGLESGPDVGMPAEEKPDQASTIIDDLDNAIDNFFGEVPEEIPRAKDPGDESPGMKRPETETAPGKTTAPEIFQAQTVRIDLDKLEDLLGDVGDLVVIKSSLTKMAEETRLLYREWMDQRIMGARKLKPLKNLFIRMGEQVDALERTVRDLQDRVMNMRMLPVSHLFNRYPRIVRDLSRKLGRKVELVMAGTDTSLDKRMMEQVADPLLHIVRNAVDHGIEPPEIRARMGKNEIGRLEISASQEGNFVLIRVTDDGRGLDREALTQKAVSLGLMSREEAQSLSEEKIWELIFYPGISTSETVSETSGRGVGMDVVKKNIQRLGGVIKIFSETGHGTTMELRVPLTLAIIQALLVRVGKQNMAIPLSGVQEAVRLTADDIGSVEGFEVISVRQKTMPLIRLGKIFRGTGADVNKEKVFVVIVNHGGTEAGLGVDRLLGQQEVVIKPLAEYLTNQPGFSGSTVLGDGSVALIVDVAAVLDRARSFADRQARFMDRISFDGTGNPPGEERILH